MPFSWDIVCLRALPFFGTPWSWCYCWWFGKLGEINYCRVLPTSILTPSLQISLTLRIYKANLRGSSCMQVDIAYLASSLAAKIQDHIRIPSFFIQFSTWRYASSGKEVTYKLWHGRRHFNLSSINFKWWSQTLGCFHFLPIQILKGCPKRHGFFF